LFWGSLLLALIHTMEQSVIQNPTSDTNFRPQQKSKKKGLVEGIAMALDP